MYWNQHLDSDDEDQWLAGMETIEDELEIKEAVRVQDPIATLDLPKPLTVEKGTNLRHALDILQEKRQNCILVVKDNVLKGILTERDILLKVTGKGYDLNLVTIEEFMTPDPEYLNLEDPLAYALNKMHIGGFRHVPIVNDEFVPVGLIGITDIISTIADYFSREIINLPPLGRQVDSGQPEGG